MEFKKLIELYNSPIIYKDCETLIHYVKTNKIPNDLPELVSRYLARIKLYLTTYNDKSRVIRKVYCDLNKRKNPRRFIKERTLIKKYILSKPPSRKTTVRKVITHPPLKIAIEGYVNPFFNFQQKGNIPIKWIRYNFKTKCLYIYALEPCEKNVYSRRGMYYSKILVDYHYFTFKNLFVMFFIYEVERHYRYFRRKNPGAYNSIYCLILNTENLKNKPLERYKLVPLKRAITPVQVLSINNPLDIIPLIHKDYTKSYENFLQTIGITPSSKKASGLKTKNLSFVKVETHLTH